MAHEHSEIEIELAQAQAAKASGHIGRARVCARRAAGIAIREWYKRRAGSGRDGDAMKRLQWLQADALVSENVRKAARRLTTVVDLDHRLPFEDDPIEDARLIIASLAKEAG